MTRIAHLVARDLGQAWRGGALWLPVGFFVLVAILYPFAVGPDARLLATTGGGMIWVAALLAALLPVERLVAPDHRAGVLDQFVLRGISEEAIMLAKLLAHWIGFAVPLLVATPIAGALLGLRADDVVTGMLGLALGTPALAALAILVAALTVALRGASAVGGLLLLPLAVPILIFGAGMLTRDGNASWQLLAASSLFLVAITPFAAAAALRAARD